MRWLERCGIEGCRRRASKRLPELINFFGMPYSIDVEVPACKRCAERIEDESQGYVPVTEGQGGRVVGHVLSFEHTDEGLQAYMEVDEDLTGVLRGDHLRGISIGYSAPLDEAFINEVNSNRDITDPKLREILALSSIETEDPEDLKFIEDPTWQRFDEWLDTFTRPQLWMIAVSMLIASAVIIGFSLMWWK